MPTSRYVVQCPPGIREVISGSSPLYGSVVPAPRRHERVPVRGGPAAQRLDRLQQRPAQRLSAYSTRGGASAYAPALPLPPFDVVTA